MTRRRPPSFRSKWRPSRCAWPIWSDFWAHCLVNVPVGHDFHFPDLVLICLSISLNLSEKLTSSTGNDESSPRKGIAIEAQLTSDKSKSTARSNCGFNIQLGHFLSSLFHQKWLSRCSAFLFCSSTFFFIFVGKLYIVPPFGTGLISSTVKPVNYDHRRDWEKAVLILRWSQLPGLFQCGTHYMGLKLRVLYFQVVSFVRWLLGQVWLYLDFSAGLVIVIAPYGARQVVIAYSCVCVGHEGRPRAAGPRATRVTYTHAATRNNHLSSN